MREELDNVINDPGIIGEIYTNSDEILDEVALFSGGVSKFSEFFHQNYIYPEGETESGKILQQLTINKIGKVIDVHVFKSLSPACDQETVRVAYLLPAYSPAKFNGRPVTVKELIPVMVTKPEN